MIILFVCISFLPSHCSLKFTYHNTCMSILLVVNKAQCVLRQQHHTHASWSSRVKPLVVALIVVVPLLFMEGQKALRFHQKYFNLCSEDEGKSCGFETT